MDNHKTKLEVYFFVVLFLAVLYLAFFIFLPFLIPISVAIALAVLSKPLYAYLLKLLGNRESLAAILTITIVALVIFAPLASIGILVFQEAISFSENISSGNASGISYFAGLIENRIAYFFPGFSLSLSNYAQLAINWLVGNLGTIFSGIAHLLLGLFIGLLAFYYLLKDGGKFLKSLVVLSPLPDVYDREIFSKLQNAINSVFRGVLPIAIIQGMLTGLGLALFGVPNPALSGTVAGFAALIPGIGTSLVLIPAIIYLFVTGPLWASTGLLVWGMLAVGLVDNLLGPKLMKRGMHIHSFLILLSVVGGLSFFGPIGFLLGPLVLSLLFALIEVYGLLTRPA